MSASPMELHLGDFIVRYMKMKLGCTPSSGSAHQRRAIFTGSPIPKIVKTNPSLTTMWRMQTGQAPQEGED